MTVATGTLPQGTRIGRIALRVSDRDAMVEFYQTVVGLSLIDQSSTISVLGVGDTPILVIEEVSDVPPRPGSASGLFHTAFRVPSREALGAALSRIQNHWQLRGAVDHRVSEALYVTDPEGNGVEIYRDFSYDEWPITDDGSIQLGNDPLDIDQIEAVAGSGRQAPSGTDIGHIHLEVSSLEAFRDCYIDTLGFETKTALANAYFVSSGRYHHHIAANTWNGRTTPLSGRGLSWFEVILPETEAFEFLRDRLAGSQWTVTETDEGLAVTDADETEIRFREHDVTI